MVENIKQIPRDAGVDLDSALVNSTDDKWKYGYKIAIDKSANIVKIAVPQNENPYAKHGWSQYSNHITDSDME